MTSNQLRYHELQETKRSNLAKEAQNVANLAETRRSNLVREKQTDRQILETVRSNLAKEKENNRTNLANEEIKRISNQLKSREISETERHNLQVEKQAYQTYLNSVAQTKVQEHNADTADRSQSQSERMEGYNKAESVTRTISNVSSALFGKQGLFGGIGSAVKSFFKGGKK